MARATTYDQEKVKELRMAALNDILEVLKESSKAKKFGKFKQEMLLKLAGTVLPRVNELTGKDGGAIQIQGNKIAFATFSPEDSVDG